MTIAVNLPVIALSWLTSGTPVPFSDLGETLSLVFEQFWGRAARASMTRKSRDACLIWGDNFKGEKGAACFARRPFQFVLSLVTTHQLRFTHGVTFQRVF